MAAILFTACTQDELAEQGNALPDGEYPLQIGSVSIDVESSAEPWSADGPQTRVTEDNTDGKSSVWQWDGSETIRVQLGDETADYTLGLDQSLAPNRQLYWTSTAPATVTAWYPTDETVDLSDQSNGLAYMLKAEVPGATYNNEITLGFTHQLAKVRVVLSGTQAARAQSVEVYGYTTCTNNEGTPVTDGSTQGWLKMKNTTYTDGTECWEANVLPGNITLDNFVRINGQTATINEGFPTMLEAAKMYTITINVNSAIPDDAQEITGAITISDDGNYVVRNELNAAITITGGSPNIYLEDAQLSVSGGNAIDITGGDPTIHVRGEGNTITSSDKTGIFVAENSTVTITGNGREDKLTVRGGAGSSGIGGYLSREDPAPACGNIEIRSVWIEAYGSASSSNDVAPGIGGAGSASCGTITIDDATVYAYGIEAIPQVSGSAIGGGIDIREKKGSFVTITIRNNSEVYVQRGNSYSDYIGNSGTMYSPATATDGIDATVDGTSTVTKLN